MRKHARRFTSDLATARCSRRPILNGDQVTQEDDEAMQINADPSQYRAEVTHYGCEKSPYEPEANPYARKRKLNENCGTQITSNEN